MFLATGGEDGTLRVWSINADGSAQGGYDGADIFGGGLFESQVVFHDEAPQKQVTSAFCVCGVFLVLVNGLYARRGLSYAV